MDKAVQVGSLSHPEKNREVKKAWENFLSGMDYSADVALRPAIDDSWRRCLVSHVDPARRESLEPLARDSLEALRQRHHRLLSASAPFLVQARDLLAQTGTVMILTDPDGTILDVEGDLRLKDALERIRLIPGAPWNESASGTNAIGTSLALGQAVQVHGFEHFCEGMQKWSCSATPVRDPNTGSVLGVLDISGLATSYQRHILPLVAMTAGRIENHLAQRELTHRLELLERGVQHLAADEGGLLFDCHGNLIRSNDQAAAALAAREIGLAQITRIAALAPPAEGVIAEPLPAWLKDGRIDPIHGHGELLGFAVSLPVFPPRRSMETPVAARPIALPKAGASLLSAALDRFSSLVWLKNTAGRYLFVNRRFEEVFGLESAAIVGRSDEELLGPEAAGPMRQRDLDACRQPSGTDSLETLGFGKRSQLLKVARIPILDEDGRTVAVCAQAETALPSADSLGGMRTAGERTDSGDEGVLVTDGQGRILTVNPAFSQITGYSAADVLGKTPGILKSGLHSREFYTRMWHDLRHEGRWQGEIQNRRKNGEIFPEWLSIYAIRGAQGDLQNYIAIFGDASAAAASRRQLGFLSSHDALTGLPDRKLFLERLTEDMAGASRGKAGLTIVVFGLDSFKNINDSLGHEAGEQFLQQTADRLRRSLGDAHGIGRLGGGEFAVILPAAAFADTCHRVATILDYLSTSCLLGGKEVSATASAGISRFPADSASAAGLVRNARAALREARKAGHCSYRFFAGDMEGRLEQRILIETALRAAIREDRFRMVYQPQDDLASGAIVGAEALLRWNDPTLGEVPASRFIPVAEESGLIAPLGDLVLDKVLSQIELWRQQGLPLPRISINVAARQLRSADFPEMLRQRLERHHVPPAAICIELTEGTLMEDLEETSRILGQLNASGIAVSIDDFGTGYSSLAYLSRLPIQELKVDQSFVRGLAEEANKRSITTAIIDMAHALKLHVLAEGIETEAQRTILMNQSCEFGQGYLFHRPLSTEAFEKVLATGTVARIASGSPTAS